MFAAIVALCLTAAPADPPKEKGNEVSEAAKKELKKLEGKWKIVKTADSTKERETEATDPEWFLVFKGNELTWEFGEKKGTFRITAIDADTDPKCIDLVYPATGKTEHALEGVYKIDGDTLQIALSDPRGGKQRPVGFDKPTDARTWAVWTLKRVKD